MMQPSTTMMKIVTFLAYGSRRNETKRNETKRLVIDETKRNETKQLVFDER